MNTKNIDNRLRVAVEETQKGKRVRILDQKTLDEIDMSPAQVAQLAQWVASIGRVEGQVTRMEDIRYPKYQFKYFPDWTGIEAEAEKQAIKSWVPEL